MRLSESLQRKRDRHPRRVGAESAKPRRHDIHRPARPLRPDADHRRGALGGRSPRGCRPRRPRMGAPGHGPRRRAPVQEPQDAHGRHRGGGRADQGAQRSADPAVHHRGEFGRRRRPAHEVPLPRPASSAPAAQHDPAPQDGPGDPPLPRRRGIPRDRDPPI